MELQVTKQFLTNKLKKNKFDTVFFELRRLIKPSSENYKALLATSFKYHTIKENEKKGILYGETYDIELNKISSALFYLISELKEVEIYETEFEETFKKRAEEKKKKEPVSSSKEKKSSISKVWSGFKYFTTAILAIGLFFVDGLKVVENTIPPLSVKLN